MSLSETELFMSDPRSKSVEGMIAGLQILAKYMPNKEQQKFFFQAEHDEVFFNVEVTSLEEDTEDGRALVALGFHVSGDVDQWAWFT